MGTLDSIEGAGVQVRGVTVGSPDARPLRCLDASTAQVTFGPDVTLTVEDIERIAQHTEQAALTYDLTSAARVRMQASRQSLALAVESGEEIYGVTTGFGPFVTCPASTDAVVQGTGLVNHLGAGWGGVAPLNIARATMVIRAQALAQGCSAVSDQVVEGLMRLLERGVHPAIPEIGSVGASGDLIPLAHVVRCMTGEGSAVLDGSIVNASDALRSAGVNPIEVPARDALGVVNGTSFMSAYAALTLARAERLIDRAEQITGWLYRLLGCRDQALDPRLHAARGQQGQADSAERIRREASRYGSFTDSDRPLQEVYSLRCAPQFIGAAREQIAHARKLITAEINHVNDNPISWPGDNAVGDAGVFHGGNFQGQQIGFASDAINTALVQIAILAERQLDVITNPEFNDGAPLLLAETPGRDAGMAGAQITCTALTAEIKAHGHMHANASMPTNGRNQDVVSMGTMAARMAFSQTERVAGVLAILGIGAAQLTALRERGRAEGRLTPVLELFEGYTPFRHDRALYSNIQSMSARVLSPNAA